MEQYSILDLVLEVIVGSEATLNFNAAKAAFAWER